MIVSDRTDAAKRPLVIHNIGSGAQEEDRLFEFKLTGHYRVTTIEPGAWRHSAECRTFPYDSVRKRS